MLYRTIQTLFFCFLLSLLSACSSGGSSNTSSSSSSSSSSSGGQSSVYGSWHDGDRVYVLLSQEQMVITSLDQYYQCLTGISFTHTIESTTESGFTTNGEDGKNYSIKVNREGDELSLVVTDADGNEGTRNLTAGPQMNIPSCIDAERQGQLFITIEFSSLIEDFSPLANNSAIEYVSWFTSVDFDMDNDGERSDGDLTVGVDGYIFEGNYFANLSSISELEPTLGSTYLGNTLPVAIGEISVAENKIQLIVSSRAHPQVNNITTATQISATASLTIDDVSRRDDLPDTAENTIRTYTDGVDTSLVTDVTGDFQALEGFSFDIVSVRVELLD